MELKKNINLLFDAKILSGFYKKKQSGMYFVALNVLNEFAKNENVHITLIYPPLIKSLLSFRKLKSISFNSKIRIIFSDAKSEYFYVKKYNNPVYNYLRLIELKLIESFSFIRKAIKNTQFYLSPYYSIPDIILRQNHIKKYYILHDAIPFIFSHENNVFDKILTTFNKDIYAFCVSQSCKEDFLQYFGDKLDSKKMFVTYNSTNQNYIPKYNKLELIRILKKYSIKYNHNDKYIFSLNNFDIRKNLPFTITCFLKFIKKHNIQDLYFFIGGRIGNSSELELLNILSITGEWKEYKHYIKKLGYINTSDLNILYSNSLFFTFLSQYEGFGMPPLEAMQAGTPVITSNNSSLPEVAGDAAIILTYNDEKAVIKAFEDLYFNEDLRKRYIIKGLERAKIFSWKKTVDKMINILMDS